jgi:competence transcription factor ComK
MCSNFVLEMKTSNPPLPFPNPIFFFPTNNNDNNNIVWRDLIHIYLFNFENMERKKRTYFNNENEI